MKRTLDFPERGNTYKPLGRVARTHRQRRKGLSGIVVDDSPDEMVFERCRSIHTFGMKFDLRVIFLDGNNRVLDVQIVRPRRVVFAPRATRTIVEQPLR